MARVQRFLRILGFYAKLCGLCGLFLALAAFCACEGCKSSGGADGARDGRAAVDAVPAARLYLVSDLAGALEPCGCVKDQLGGMDHFGALVAGEKDKARASGVLSAGPLFFMDMELAADRRAQEITKAQTIAATMKTLGLLAFTPGRNDWAGGADTLKKLAEATSAPLVVANLVAGPEVAPAAVKWTKTKVGSIALGIIGVAAPDKAKLPLDGVTSSPATDAVKTAVAALKKDGVQAIVVLAAVGRGEAKRIADLNPELLAILVGGTGGGGEANTEAPPAESIGDVLIVETGNHLQTAAVIDLYPREGATTGPGLLRFADGTGIERVRKGEELRGRIDELRVRISTWETDKSVEKKDVDARKAELAKLEAERDALDKAPAPATGSYYRYAMREIRDKLGDDAAIKSQMSAYYKKVNDANKLEFADRKPKPPAKGEAFYVGIDSCTNCHEEPRKVWDQTKHAHAYATLSTQFKEFNLDCVSCHVTGYDRPGGSTVTHVEELKNVQCEDCHGPGSLHAAKPEKVHVPVAKPGADVCLSCHHPPHVHTFDAQAKMAEILGPGHGKSK
jgi:hypothetical protein